MTVLFAQDKTTIMEQKARLIYKSYMTYFHTFLPVYFYGMPNGKVYCFYARFIDNKTNRAGLEFIFARHDDFSYDYDSDRITTFGNQKITRKAFIDWVDKPDQRITELKVCENLSSYAEAHSFINQKAQMMLHCLETEPV